MKNQFFSKKIGYIFLASTTSTTSTLLIISNIINVLLWNCGKICRTLLSREPIKKHDVEKCGTLW